MALKPCQECGREVSSRASACPACGCPIGSGRALGTENAPVTTQRTRKSLKLFSFLFGVTFWLSLFVFIIISSAETEPGSENLRFWFYTMLVSFCGWAFSKMLIWWHHG